VLSDLFFVRPFPTLEWTEVEVISFGVVFLEGQAVCAVRHGGWSVILVNGLVINYKTSGFQERGSGKGVWASPGLEVMTCICRDRKKSEVVQGGPYKKGDPVTKERVESSAGPGGFPGEMFLHTGVIDGAGDRIRTNGKSLRASFVEFSEKVEPGSLVNINREKKGIREVMHGVEGERPVGGSYAL